MQRTFDDETRIAIEEAIDASIAEISDVIEKIEAFINKFPQHVVPGLESVVLGYLRRLHYFQCESKIGVGELFERVEATDIRTSKKVQENGLKTAILQNKIESLIECFRPLNSDKMYPLETI
ncbi:MAG: hypothetical protein FWG40_11380, partial [Peptococcaceae bacterium]|nr:hypothetical protein [Peptococcaceae bacterium]